MTTHNTQPMTHLTEHEIFQLAREKASGQTQKQIAKKLGVRQSAVSQMLSGKRQMLFLAVRFLEPEVRLERDDSGLVRYYKAVEG